LDVTCPPPPITFIHTSSPLKIVSIANINVSLDLYIAHSSVNLCNQKRGVHNLNRKQPSEADGANQNRILNCWQTRPSAPSHLLIFFPQSCNLYIHSSYYIHGCYPCTIDWTDQRFNTQSSFTKWSSKYSLWSSVHPLRDQILPRVYPLNSWGTRSPFSIHTERLQITALLRSTSKAHFSHLACTPTTWRFQLQIPPWVAQEPYPHEREPSTELWFLAITLWLPYTVHWAQLMHNTTTHSSQSRT
jgi:hypothetical protein